MNLVREGLTELDKKILYKEAVFGHSFMSSRAFLRLVSPTALPHVWQVGAQAEEEDTLPTGHALLDRCLPGGGWPVGSLVELLQAKPEPHVWQLLLPALAQAVKETKAGPVVLVGPPLQPFGPSLAAQGLPAERLLCVQPAKPPARLWATEQALRCAEVAAVMAWLPQVKSAQLRRLHLAAQQQGRLLFVMRGLGAAAESSPARLRLRVEGGQDVMRVHILKRRGPPLEAPVVLPAHAPRVAALLASRKTGAAAPAADVVQRQKPGGSHVLDRTAAHA